MWSGISGCECSAGARKGALLASMLLQAFITLTGSIMGKHMGTSTPTAHLIKCLKFLYVFLFKIVSVSQRKAGGND